MLLEIVLVAGLVAAAMFTVAASRIMWSVVGLAVASAILTALMFDFGSPLAAVFELSVCAGLIPAIFISTISLTRRVTPEALVTRRREKFRRYALLPVLVVAVALVLLKSHLPLDFTPPPPEDPTSDVRTLFWHVRHIDLIGQIVVLLGGALAIVALLKEPKHDK
jgi:NADH-quinone oxidoreductase subunit J